MKKIAVAITLSFLVVGSFEKSAYSAEIDTAPYDKWAVVVGIGKYSDPAITPSKFAAKDATDFASFLVNSEHFAQDHVRLLLNEKATRIEIWNQLGDKFLPHSAMPRDLVVVYFSAQAVQDPLVKGSFLLPYDADTQKVYQTGIGVGALPQNLGSRVHSGRVLIFIDSSYSGYAADKPRSVFIPRDMGLVVMTACKANETACESKSMKNGIFTHYLIEDLRKAGSDSTLSHALKRLPEQVFDAAKKDCSSEQNVTKSTWTDSDPKLGAEPAHPRLLSE